jgi:hypothetical protein
MFFQSPFSIYLYQMTKVFPYVKTSWQIAQINNKEEATPMPKWRTSNRIHKSFRDNNLGKTVD